MKYKTAHSASWALATWTLCVLILSGCATQPPVSSRADAPPPPPVTSAAQPAPPPEAVEKKPAVIPQRKPLFDMAALVGLDESGVRRVLGEPTIVNENPPGRTWRYKDRACAVDIAFYPDVKTRNFYVLSYEVTSDDRSTGADRHCRTHFATLAAKK